MESDSEHVFSDIEAQYKVYCSKRKDIKSFLQPPPLKKVKTTATPSSDLLSVSSSSISPTTPISISPTNDTRTKKRRSKVIQTDTLRNLKTDKLSADQKIVLEEACGGYSIFYSGEAGTGKTFLLNEIITVLQSYWGKENVGVTSSTGISAVDINGMTIHSWAGMGLGEDLAHVIVQNMSRDAKERWRRVRVLIIDEISMISGVFFDKLDRIARIIKKNETEPFGGIQVITCGDFYQLEAINAKTEGLCFQSSVWPQLFKTQLMLTTPFRQMSDPRYGELLNSIRQGKLSDEHIKMLTSRIKQPEELEKIEGATRLLPFVEAVSRINNKRLSELPGEAHTFKGSGTHAYRCENILKNLKKNCRPPEELTLKVGAAVMLVVNEKVEEGLCNGLCGVVTSFSKTGYPLVTFPSLKNRIQEISPHKWVYKDDTGKKILATYSQVPLDLAWAMTIHKSQGATLDKVAVDLNVFAKGQAYVALSRTRTLDGLNINHLPPIDKLLPNPDVVKFYSTIQMINPN